MSVASVLKKTLLVWSPLLVLALLACGAGCGKVAVKGAPKAAALLVQKSGKVLFTEVVAADLAALMRKNGPQELEALLAGLTNSTTEEVSVTQLGKLDLHLYSKVFVHGPVDDLFASRLSESGVPFYQSLDAYNPLFHQPQEMEILFVGSKDPATFRMMYGNQRFSAIARAIDGSDKIGTMVESWSDLNSKIIAASKQNRMPIVVGHQDERGMIKLADGEFEVSGANKQLAGSPVTILSCNTFGAAGQEYRSSGLVDVESVIQGLRKARMQHPGSVSPSDFMHSFATSFKEIDKTQSLVWNAKAVGVTTGVAGTGGTMFVGGLKLADYLQGDVKTPPRPQWPQSPASELPSELPGTKSPLSEIPTKP